jgi:hypothetical protein
MSSGRCWDRCSTRPANAGPSTHRTCGGWWTRCCSSPTPAAGGATCLSRWGFGLGRTKGAKRVVAVDVTGLPVGALVVPASTHENRACELMLEHLTQQGVTARLELVLVDRGSPRPLPARSAGTTTSSCAGSGGTTSSPYSAPSGTLGASRSPTAASDAPAALRSRSRTPPPRRPAGFRSPASRPPCATCHGHLPSVHSRSQLDWGRVVARNAAEADIECERGTNWSTCRRPSSVRHGLPLMARCAAPPASTCAQPRS